MNREFIYVSLTKLSQWQPERTSLRDVVSRLSGRLKTPVADLEISSPSPPNGGDFQKAFLKLRSIEESIYLIAKWWEQDDVDAGDWILFERSLQSRIGDYLELPKTVLFMDRSPSNGNRLLLHGSAVHLIEFNYRLNSKNHIIGGAIGGSDPSSVESAALALISHDVMSKLLRLLRRQEDRESVLDDLYKEFDKDIGGVVETDWQPSRPFPRLRGLARVSRIASSSCGRVVIASPLYVEYQRYDS